MWPTWVALLQDRTQTAFMYTHCSYVTEHSFPLWWRTRAWTVALAFFNSSKVFNSCTASKILDITLLCIITEIPFRSLTQHKNSFVWQDCREITELMKWVSQLLESKTSKPLV